MNKITALLAGAAFAATATSAIAADAIISYEPVPAPAPMVYDWTGFYLGAHGGYVSTNADLSGVFDEKFDGGFLGVHAGYNFIQNGAWVFGIEGDVSKTWNEEDFMGFGIADVGTDWQWSVRGRIGYAIDRTLIYGTAGVAGTNGYIEIPLAPLKVDDHMVGWTVGVGVEHAFTDNWTARAEYRYSDYGEFKPLGIATDIDVTEHTFRVGVSYKF